MADFDGFANRFLPLGGASHDGYVRIKEMAHGMLTLRGDLALEPVKQVVKRLTATDMPGANQCLTVGDWATAWMSPDELLLMGLRIEVASDMEQASKLLKGTHHLLVDVSDARAVFSLEGKLVREVIAKLAPIDTSPEAFRVGAFRRTRLAQTPAAIWMREDDWIEIICFRSVAGYVFELLTRASIPGSQVS